MKFNLKISKIRNLIALFLFVVFLFYTISIVRDYYKNIILYNNSIKVNADVGIDDTMYDKMTDTSEIINE